MSKNDSANLLAILDAIRKIKQFLDDVDSAEAFYQDEKTFDAVLMNFVVMGEAVARLSEGLIEGEQHIPWSQIKGFRNIIAHNYFGVDAEEVWEIIKAHLPELEKEILIILK